MNKLSVAKTTNDPHLSKVPWKFAKKYIWLATSLATVGLAIGSGFWFHNRYKIATKMPIQIRELSKAEYPANPAQLSKNFSRYANRELLLIQKDETHFDFVLKPTNNQTAEIIISNVDLSLLIPSSPQRVKQDRVGETIALSEREWNRQQVSFPIDSKHIKIRGGDGFEKQNLYEIALANNCLGGGYGKFYCLLRKIITSLFTIKAGLTSPWDTTKTFSRKLIKLAIGSLGIT